MVWVSKLHLSLQNTEWELCMEEELCPAGKASLIILMFQLIQLGLAVKPGETHSRSWDPQTVFSELSWEVELQ